MKNCTLAVDVMSGNYGLESAVPAALIALQNYSNLSIILVGDETAITSFLKNIGTNIPENCQIHHTSQRIEMNDSPIVAWHHKKDSSMRVAIDLVKQNQAQACISAGNTSALVEIAHLVLKTLPGIDRPAMSHIFPTQKIDQSVRLLDIGASVDVTAEHLVQFAAMGLVLSEEIDNVIRPKLGLLNIDTTGKGNKLLQEAGTLFKNLEKKLNYIGYLEGDTIFDGEANVIICDGFSGNIASKTIEGTIKLIQSLDQAASQHWLSRFTDFVTQSTKATEQFEPDYYNGASLVGLQGTVIQSHNSADALAFKNALHYAITSIQKEVPQRIQDRINTLL